MCMSVFVFRSIYKPAWFNAVPGAGQALPSHYTGSRTNQRLRVSVSPNLSLFPLLSLVIFLFHSLRQFPSPTCPQSTLITFSSHHVLYLPHSPVNLPLVLPPPVALLCRSSLCVLSLLSGLHLTDCTLLCVSFFFSLVKDLDTEKYIHLVSISRIFL